MNTTKRAIANSLKQLMTKKPLSKITVSDITQNCGVSRMTFYYHFQDIFDLIGWICEQDILAEPVRQATYETWQESFLAILEAVRANRTFIESVMRSPVPERVERYLLKLTEEMMLDVISAQPESASVSEANQRFIASFFKHAFAGIILDWIEDGMRREPEELVHVTAVVVEGNFLNALRRLDPGGGAGERPKEEH